MADGQHDTTCRSLVVVLKVLVATTTLAMGVNTPAWSVVIAGLKHPDVPYSVAEYKNMVGRAGRLGLTPKGKAFLIAISAAEAEQLWRGYVRGRPEDLASRFADQNSLSLICRVLATAAAIRVARLSADDILDFLENSFAAFVVNYRTGRPLWSREQLNHDLLRLRDYGLIEEEAGEYRLTELGRVAGEASIEVTGVLRIVEGLRGLALGEINAATFIAAAQLTEELDNVFFPSTGNHTRSMPDGMQRFESKRSPGKLLAHFARQPRTRQNTRHGARRSPRL
jgi:helicase